MNWQTLLVPHDFSPCATHAMNLAADLARKQQGKLLVINVTHLPPGLHADGMIQDRATGELVRVDAYARAAALARLEEIVAPLRATGVAIELRAVIGEVVEELLEAAGGGKVDLIVMGTHGRTGLAHLFLGSMTEKVLRQSPVPVLTVRGSDEPGGAPEAAT